MPSGATLTGTYSIFYGDYDTLNGVASSGEKFLTFNSDGRFKSSQISDTRTFYASPIADVFGGGTSSSKDEGQYEIDGYALTLNFDSGQVIRYEPFLPYFSDIYSGEKERKVTALKLEGAVFSLRE